MESNLDLITYNRFTDDVLIISKKQTFDSIVDMFNNIDPFMTFTTEYSLNNSIHFLDLTIEIRNGELLFRHYEKTYASKSVLNYFSFASIAQKINIIKNS